MATVMPETATGDAGAAPRLPAHVRTLLDTPVFATVATIQPDGRPQLSVVWAGRAGNEARFVVTAGSRKERNLRRDPRVSLLLNPADDPYFFAVIHGIAILTGKGARELLDDLSRSYTGTDYAGYSGGSAPPGDLVAVHVTPERITSNR